MYKVVAGILLGAVVAVGCSLDYGQPQVAKKIIFKRYADELVAKKIIFKRIHECPANTRCTERLS